MSIPKLKELTSNSATPGYDSKYAFKKKKKGNENNKPEPEGTGKDRRSKADKPLLKPKEYGSMMTLLKDIIRDIIRKEYV